MLKKESAGGVIVNELNEVVIVLTNSKSWQFPKGEVEKEEDYLQTALREIEEETGLKDLKLTKELPIYTRVSIDKRVLKKIHYFLFYTKKQELKSGTDAIKCLWLPLDKAEEKITYREDKEFFRKIKEKIKFQAKY